MPLCRPPPPPDPVRAGLNTNNTATIQAAFDNLNTILGNTLAQITEVGGRQSTLQQLSDNMQGYNLGLQSIQDSYQALDYPTALSDYSQAEIAQQAALSILGKSNKQNLFNYIG
jgi:flagellin-like hook-associated protein FlgL